MTSVAELYKRLQHDPWRIENPFSTEMLQANSLLQNTAATEPEYVECLSLWCQKHQPCQFGKVAAVHGRIHFCVLTDEAVRGWSDEDIARKLTFEKKLWKQRAAFDSERAAHSFVVVVASHNVALAAPDKHLRAFSDRILELIGWAPERHVRHLNKMDGEYLYLKHPDRVEFFGFRFNADFFACAGDGRWWHDHRFPGGIAFTANSAGHMVRFRDWYGRKPKSEEWALKQAMLTIAQAKAMGDPESDDPAKQGRITWLLPVGDSGPLDAGVDCPLELPTTLKGLDWTRYQGLIHTDHAVREEFFSTRSTAPTINRQYLMDLTYLYNAEQEDFPDFTGGRLFTPEEVQSEIGTPDEWTHRSITEPTPRSEQDEVQVALQLEACRTSEPTYDYGPLE